VNDRPAILGNTPVFERKLSIVRPKLPSFAELSTGLEQILETGMVTKGQYLREFEGAVAAHLGVKHAVAVSSCTVGLMLTYRALGFTGEVIVPSFTFMATVSALIWAGASPVFADVELETTNLDPAAVEAAITPRTSAIVAVHNFGTPAAIDALRQIANRHGLKLVFDAAHGFGTLYNGTPVGSQGDAHVYSLSPTKLLIAGEGGIVATQDGDLAEAIRMGREYGNSGNYDSAFAGLNGRMSEFNALLGLHSLGNLEAAARRRNELVAIYHEQLSGLPGISFQQVRSNDRSSYKDLSIVVDDQRLGLTRDQLADALTAENVDTRKYYDPPVHRQTPYRQFDDGRPLPNTEALSRGSLSLPIWSEMDDSIVLGVCHAVKRIVAHADVLPGVQTLVTV
jgi:dTDP-4-amino-4,6-dideoxygalactose transaminase